MPSSPIPPGVDTAQTLRCECGHVHASAEQDGYVTVFHRCRARGCECREFRSLPDHASRHALMTVVLVAERVAMAKPENKAYLDAAIATVREVYL